MWNDIVDTQTPFWEQVSQGTVESPQAVLEPEPTPAPEIRNPLVLNLNRKKCCVAVPKLHSWFNHLRLWARQRPDEEWKVVADHVLPKQMTVFIDFPNVQAVELKWEGVHPERGNGFSDILVFLPTEKDTEHASAWAAKPEPLKYQMSPPPPLPPYQTLFAYRESPKLVRYNAWGQEVK